MILLEATLYEGKPLVQRVSRTTGTLQRPHDFQRGLNTLAPGETISVFLSSYDMSIYRRVDKDYGIYTLPTR